jgi:PAS domain S-box-containing protein
VPFPLPFWLFCAFVWLCGCAYLLDAATAVLPVYRLAGAAKLLTAAVSWITILTLVTKLPRGRNLPSPGEQEAPEEAEERPGEAELSASNSRLECLLAEQSTAAATQAQQLDQVQRKLRRQGRILETVLDCTEDGVIVADANGRFLHFNRAAERIFGCDANAAKATTLWEWMAAFPYRRTDSTENLPTEERPLARALRGETGTAEVRFGDPHTGQERWLTARALPLNEPEGELQGVVGIYHDITESKRPEQQLQATRDELHALTAYLESVREEERTRIARELHDELGQTLTAVKMDLAWVRDRLTGNDLAASAAVLQEKVRGIGQLIDDTIQLGRRLATELRPGVLDDLGLVAALEWLAEDFQRRYKISCGFISEKEELEPGWERATAVFRIAQEALTNVVRHANATNVGIGLRTDADAMILEIEDNGIGISEPSAPPEHHTLGLLGMRERAKHLGGSLEITSEPGKGTRVTARIPLRGKPLTVF